MNAAVLVALAVLAGTAVVVGLHLAATRWLVLIIVEGASMAPAYRPDDRVLVWRRDGRRVGRGQVVVIEQPELGHGWARLPPPDGDLAGRHWYLKRVAAVAGDPVPAEVAPVVASVAPAVVPPGMLVVLGDAQPSDDSRQWGYFPAERVLGVVVRRLGGDQPDPVR